MKNSKNANMALAALTAFTATTASAQSSSVTIFGLVDLSLRSVTHRTEAGSVSQKSMSQDGDALSRLGFRGIEDLGGGMRAGFWLEGALNADTGNAAGFSFQRRSTVSLISDFGEIRLGRDYVPTHWNTPTYDPFNGTGVGSVNNTLPTLNGATTGARANNSVGYFLPTIGGLFGQVMVAAGEGVVGNKHFGGRIGYAGGPVSVAVAAGKTEVDSVRDFDRFNVGGSYDLSFVKLMFEYQRSKASGGEDDNKEVVLYLMGGTVPFGAGTVKFSYVKSDGKGALATSDASQIALGYRHDLSKRTGVYASMARVSNKGTATYAVSGGVGTPSAGKDSSGYEVGLRHIF